MCPEHERDSSKELEGTYKVEERLGLALADDQRAGVRDMHQQCWKLPQFPQELGQSGDKLADGGGPCISDLEGQGDFLPVAVKLGNVIYLKRTRGPCVEVVDVDGAEVVHGVTLAGDQLAKVRSVQQQIRDPVEEKMKLDHPDDELVHDGNCRSRDLKDTLPIQSLANVNVSGTVNLNSNHKVDGRSSLRQGLAELGQQLERDGEITKEKIDLGETRGVDLMEERRKGKAIIGGGSEYQCRKVMVEVDAAVDPTSH